MHSVLEAAEKGLHRSASEAVWASPWSCLCSVRELRPAGLRLNRRGREAAVTRGFAALFVLLAASMAWAQEPNPSSSNDYRHDPAESRQEQRQRMREARQEF